jgi:hypothetical protein
MTKEELVSNAMERTLMARDIVNRLLPAAGDDRQRKQLMTSLWKRLNQADEYIHRFLGDDAHTKLTREIEDSLEIE